MAPRLLGSLAAFAAFPIYLAMRGAPTALEVAAFTWLIAPILLSWFLSRTGRYEGAHVLSSLALAGLLLTGAMTTRGIESFAAVWLVVVPLEAALLASRPVVAVPSPPALARPALLIVLVHVADRPAYRTALSAAACGGEARSVEFRLRRDGSRGSERGHGNSVDFIWVEMRCRPLEQTSPTAAAPEAEVVAVMRDVTDRKIQ